MSSSYTERFFWHGMWQIFVYQTFAFAISLWIVFLPVQVSGPYPLSFQLRIGCKPQLPDCRGASYYGVSIHTKWKIFNLNPEGEKSFSFSKAVRERSLHRCYSADTWTAKHVVVFQFLLLQISYKYLGIANDIATLNDS